MWQAHTTPLPAERGLHFTLNFGNVPATYAQVLEAWQGNATFAEWFGALLAAAPYEAFRWETPPLVKPPPEAADDLAANPNSPARLFECVVTNSPGLAPVPDAQTFTRFYPQAEEGIVTFTNLGGDATLVVPAPPDNATAYPHLAAFLRQAPAPQRAALWRAVGRAMHERLGPKPVWLSTAGGGVSWLHVRLDDRPKYYSHAPYRTQARSKR